jgi:hypothetical protein
MQVWRHRDPKLVERAQRQLEAHARGLPGPSSRDEAAADFRAWLVDRAYVIARLLGTVDIVGDYGQITPVGPTAAASPERLEVARALYGTCKVLAAQVSATVPPTLETAAPTPTVETGALPALAIVAIAVGSVVAIGLLANQAGTVIDRQLERSEATRRMLAKDTEARTLVDQHLERETTAGKALPFDDSERALLAELSKQSAEVAKQLPAYPSVLTPSTTSIPAFGLAGGTLLLAAAAAAVLLLRK